ncbi:MAG TPA: DMT family transporter [Xanthobacteraceae bacterium]|nr:DMT family transporter [Xanthobacteraceae bacterium]
MPPARSPVSPQRRATLAGIGLMLLGVLLFSINDAMGKWLLVTYSVGQMLLIRSVAALLLLSPLIAREGAGAFAAAPRPGLQALRVLLSTAEVAMFFWAVSYLPLADTVTFYLAGPIYVTALSALVLREQVGWRRWSAVLIGFAGVLIALKPSPATLTWPALIALAGSFFFAVLMIVTRYLRGTSDLVLASGQIGATFVFGAVTAPFGWVMPSLRDYLLMSLLGVIAVFALMSVNRSLKLAPASVVVPYQYTLIVWAVVLGYLVFGDVPQPHVLIGSTIIIAAGLFIFWREQVAMGREPPVVPPP